MKANRALLCPTASGIKTKNGIDLAVIFSWFMYFITLNRVCAVFIMLYYMYVLSETIILCFHALHGEM